jgi:hypothetical protein
MVNISPLLEIRGAFPVLLGIPKVINSLLEGKMEN